MVTKTKKKIADNRAYPSELQEVFRNDITCHTELLLEKIKVIHNEWQEHADADVFFSKYQTVIINHATDYFQMDSHLAGLIAVKLRDITFSFFNSKSQLIISPKPITPEERDGLQYLAGYVIQKLIKNVKKCKTTPSCVLDILMSMVTEPSSQKLIRIQSRGGLTAVNDDANTLFLKAEEIFRNNTSIHIQHIQINSMIEQLLSDVQVTGVFNGIIDNAGFAFIEQELKNNILLTIFKLFLRIRAYSLSRDIVARHRQEMKIKKVNKKGLRKTLKELSCNGENNIDFMKN